MGKHSDWKKTGTGLIDRLFQYRFVQQFAALSYKNGEQGLLLLLLGAWP
jgi:hypothetical protein